MPDAPRGGRRRLNITSCVEGYKSTNSKGPYTLYNIEAADPDTNVKISAKFNSFAMIPTGVAEYDLSPYMKNGVLESWTIQAPKGTQSQALAQRVEFLDSEVAWCRDEINGLKAMVQRLSSVSTPLGGPPSLPTAGPPTGSQGAPPTTDDDIPF